MSFAYLNSPETDLTLVGAILTGTITDKPFSYKGLDAIRQKTKKSLNRQKCELPHIINSGSNFNEKCPSVPVHYYVNNFHYQVPLVFKKVWGMHEVHFRWIVKFLH